MKPQYQAERQGSHEGLLTRRDAIKTIARAVPALMLAQGCASTNQGGGAPAAAQTEQRANDQKHGEVANLREQAWQHRTGRAMLRLRWARGPVPSGTAVRWELRHHAIRFGINLHWWQRTEPAVQERCRSAVRGLFNTATIPCYWGQSLYAHLPPFEAERGKTRLGELLEAGRWCREQTIRPKGHPLIFFREPAWVGALPQSEQEAAYWKHIHDIVAGCRGVIDGWEVVNEPTTGFAQALSFSAPGMAGLADRHGVVGVIAKAHEAALAANPDAELIQNDWVESEKYAAICRQVIESKVRIDAIGLQHHATGGLASAESLRALLERFAALGRPVHITEIMIPSGPAELRSRGFRYLAGYVTTREGEARQAKEAELLYRRLFAHPSVQAITWWDLCDAFSCQEIPFGLLRADGSLKPAYEALQKLINDEWRSRGTSRVDPAGVLRMEGFAGAYEVTTELNGRALRGRFDLESAATDAQHDVILE